MKKEQSERLHFVDCGGHTLCHHHYAQQTLYVVKTFKQFDLVMLNACCTGSGLFQNRLNPGGVLGTVYFKVLSLRQSKLKSHPQKVAHCMTPLVASVFHDN